MTKDFTSVYVLFRDCETVTHADGSVTVLPPREARFGPFEFVMIAEDILVGHIQGEDMQPIAQRVGKNWATGGTGRGRRLWPFFAVLTANNLRLLDFSKEDELSL